MESETSARKLAPKNLGARKPLAKNLGARKLNSIKQIVGTRNHRTKNVGIKKLGEKHIFSQAGYDF